MSLPLSKGRMDFPGCGKPLVHCGQASGSCGIAGTLQLPAQSTACLSFTQLPLLTEELPGLRNVTSPFCFFLITVTVFIRLFFF